ncbi:MAG: hypothetical protein V1777_00935 [Candidatus Micrarchaeota archaeon]
MNAKKWLEREKKAIAFSVLVVAVVGFAYWSVPSAGASTAGMASETPDSSLSIYSGLSLKLAFTDAGEAKVFALAKSNALAKFSVLKGNPLPEKDSMVLGETEARLMESENLFSKPGDPIKDFFGLNPTVEGILEKTNSPADYFHFLSSPEFDRVTGNPDALFIKMSDDSKPAVFYQNQLDRPLFGSARLAEGNLADYQEHTIVGTVYYPIILGSQEAKLLRAEKTFQNLGDTFEKFGRRFIVVGILEKNNSILDLAYVTPLGKNDWTANKNE